MSNSAIKWVGHRGLPQAYPENSLAGIAAAMQAGAAAVEVDIQFSAEGEPVLFHDATLDRVTDTHGSVADFSLAQLARISAHEPRRLGNQFAPCPIAHLGQLVVLMQSYPQCKVFVEIKSEIFERHSRQQVLTLLTQQLLPIRGQYCFISYDLYILRLAQEQFDGPVGWVLSHYDSLSAARVKSKPVDYLICNVNKLPGKPQTLWSGPWQWFIYDIVAPDTLARCLELGVEWLESWDVATMIGVPEAGALDINTPEMRAN